MSFCENMMKGKRGIIFGVANDKSIAWGIAQQLHEAGAELAFTYALDQLESRVRPLAESVDSDIILKCDVTDESQIQAVFDTLKERWGKIDYVVHSIAYANKDDLKDSFSQTSYDGFSIAMNISVYSFISVTRHALPVLNKGGSIITLTYLGAQRVVPHYNIMGVAKAALEASVRYLAAELGERNIRVNAVSAGPIRTLASSGIAHFKDKIKIMDKCAPMRRTVTQEEVGKSALYLLSDLSTGVTGEVHYVDVGFNTVVSG